MGRSEPEPQGCLRIFNFLPNEKNYIHACISLFLASFFGFLSLLLLGTIVAAPDKFVMSFTLTIFTLIAGLASMSGPRSYVKNLFRNKNLYASIVLMTCIVLSLYFSMVQKAYLMSLLMAIIELNAVLFFFCNTTAISLNTVKYMAKAFWTMLTGWLGRIA